MKKKELIWLSITILVGSSIIGSGIYFSTPEYIVVDEMSEDILVDEDGLPVGITQTRIGQQVLWTTDFAPNVDGAVDLGSLTKKIRGIFAEGVSLSALWVDGPASINSALFGGGVSVSGDFSIASSGWSSGDDYGPSFYVDVDTEKVGIGTTAPDSIFHIKANIPGTVGSHPAGQLIIQNPNDTVYGNVVITAYESDGAGNPDQQLWYLGSSSGSNSEIIFLNRRNSKLHMGTNGVSRLTILGNGNVGIGDSDPSYMLSVDDTTSISGDFYFGDSLLWGDVSANEIFASADFNFDGTLKIDDALVIASESFAAWAIASVQYDLTNYWGVRANQSGTITQICGLATSGTSKESEIIICDGATCGDGGSVDSVLTLAVTDTCDDGVLSSASFGAGDYITASVSDGDDSGSTDGISIEVWVEF